jgi:hypothetical protein
MARDEFLKKRVDRASGLAYMAVHRDGLVFELALPPRIG